MLVRVSAYGIFTRIGTDLVIVPGTYKHMHIDMFICANTDLLSINYIINEITVT